MKRSFRRLATDCEPGQAQRRRTQHDRDDSQRRSRACVARMRAQDPGQALASNCEVDDADCQECDPGNTASRAEIRALRDTTRGYRSNRARYTRRTRRCR